MGNADSVLWRQSLVEAKDYPTALDLGLCDSKALEYEARKQAIEMKGQRSTAKEIEQKTGLSRQLLHYYMKQTANADRFGKPLGYRALLKDRTRRAKPTASLGVLNSLTPKPYQLTAYFRKHPKVYDLMYLAATQGRVPSSTKDGPPLSTALLQEIFYQQATAAGTTAPFFPFNGPDERGREYLRRWVKKVRAEHEAEGRIAKACRKLTNPWAEFEDSPLCACFDEVECDGHYIDIDWIINFPSLTGEGTLQMRVSRLWLIPVMECQSGAALGYSTALGTNYAGSDVARAVRNALVPWKPRELSTTKIAYKPGDCLPSAHPELAWVCWNRMKLDRAKSHMADYFLNTLERGINCVPEFGPVGEPDARPRIEGLFELLEEAGFRNVRGRLGSHPKDPKRDDKVDHVFCIDYELLLDFIDLLVTRYNAGSRDGSTTSRVDVLRNAVGREHRVFRRLPMALRESYLEYDIFSEALIRRDTKHLVVRWKDARYYGPALDLVGDEFVDEPVAVQANSKDARKIKVSLLRDGTPIGILDVELRWRSTQHSLTTRQAAKRLRKGNSTISMAADIALAIRAEMETRGLRNGNRFVRSSLGRLIVEQGAAIPPGSPPAESAAPGSQPRLPPPEPPHRHDARPAVANTQTSGQPAELSARRKRIALLGSAHRQT